jgi:L-rhamnose mutarotase
MEMQMVFYQNSVINETYEVSHTTTYVLVANALSNSDINNYLILIYQEKMSDRDM